MPADTAKLPLIDVARKGNVVRFYLGFSDRWQEAWGNGWRKVPYEHNADGPYREFVAGWCDWAFAFDDVVVEPHAGELNSAYTKRDFLERRAPRLVVVLDGEHADPGWNGWTFTAALAYDGLPVTEYYCGDLLTPTHLTTKEDVHVRH